MSDPPSTDPLIGRTVAQYEILGKLGGGAMGVVYKARDTRLGRSVALKFLPPQWSHDESAKQRFVREAQAASATNHRNICVIHNIEETGDGRLFIVMAYYEGETLKQRLERGPLPIEDVIEIGSEIAEGLARAHAQGVVHRDIKPGNLMLTDDGVKILDFGLAKFADALQLTIAGSSIGTASYMSPEQARGDEADARSDVWALGVVLFEMLTGRVPFSGGYVEATLLAIKTEPLPSLRALRPDVPETLERLVTRALEKDPAGRFENARVPARDLRFLAGRSVPLELRTEPVAVAAARRGQRGGQQRRRMAWLAAALLLLAVAVPAAWFWWPRERIGVAVVPVANHTGVPELDGYAMALTQALIDEIDDSRRLRVVPFLRLLEIARPFAAGDRSGTAAIQAIASETKVPFLIVPTLIYRDRDASWLIQTQIRNAQTGTTAASFETVPVTSSLSEQTALRLLQAAAGSVHEHFGGGVRAGASSQRFQSPAAALAFAQGLDAYDQLEYAAAVEALTQSSTLDSQRSLTFAWLGRALLVLGRKNEAIAAAQRATSLLANSATELDAAFVNAVLAEAQGSSDEAERAYQALAALDPDNAWLHLELADYLKRRQDANQRSIDAYHRALELDDTYIRPHVDLCQLYTRLDDHPMAEKEATTAIERYRAKGISSGEAQAALCLGEAQREQGRAHLDDARQNIERSRALIAPLDQPFNLARVLFYKALVEYSDGRMDAASAGFEEAASQLRAAGNGVLEGVALMNLGIADTFLGRPSRAVEFFRRSRDAFLAVGDERRVAEADVNRATLEIDHGGDLAGVSRTLANAQTNLERLGHVDFQLAAMHSEANAYRYLGALDRARTVLRAAIGLARSRDLAGREKSLVLALAQTDTQAGAYDAALASIEPLVSGDAGRGQLQARISHGALLTRLGRFDEAVSVLRAVAADIGSQQRVNLLPWLHLALADLALEQGDARAARAEYDLAVTAWSDPLAHPASLEARCRRAWLGGVDGARQQARAELAAAMADADRSGRVATMARCRVDLARLHLLSQDADVAEELLGAIPDDTPERTLGLELRAQVDFWRSQARRLQRADSAPDLRVRARAAIAALLQPLPEATRQSVLARSEIRVIVTE